MSNKKITCGLLMFLYLVSTGMCSSIECDEKLYKIIHSKTIDLGDEDFLSLLEESKLQGLLFSKLAAVIGDHYVLREDYSSAAKAYFYGLKDKKNIDYGLNDMLIELGANAVDICSADKIKDLLRKSCD